MSVTYKTELRQKVDSVDNFYAIHIQEIIKSGQLGSADKSGCEKEGMNGDVYKSVWV